MESYVVRIYRRFIDGSKRLLGVVEKVDGKGEQAFRSREELWEILEGREKESGEERDDTSS